MFWKYHRLPDDIVSDRNVSVIGEYSMYLEHYLGTKHNLSNGFHPQMDSQQGRLNQPIEAYQRSYHNFIYNNSAEILVMAKYAHNNLKYSSKTIFPVDSNYCFVIFIVEWLQYDLNKKTVVTDNNKELIDQHNFYSEIYHPD